MREVETVEGREFEFERFRALAGWGMPEYMLLLLWLLGRPERVCVGCLC